MAIRLGCFPAKRADLPCSESAARSFLSIRPPSSSWCTPPCAKNRRSRPPTPRPSPSGSTWSRSLENDRRLLPAGPSTADRQLGLGIEEMQTAELGRQADLIAPPG